VRWRLEVISKTAARHLNLLRVVGAAQQVVGRERRERVSNHDWSGDA
jgi:hypothetical protein